MTPTRRDLLAAGVGLLAAASASASVSAIDPIKRAGKAKLAPSLAAYSFDRYLSLSGRVKPTMTLEDFVDLGKKYELPALELTAYYFPKKDREYMAAIKKRCADNGVAVSGTAVGNDFCIPDKAEVAAQMKSVKMWVENTAALGGKTMRIFAGNVRKGDTEAEALKRCVDAIGEACEFAGKHKVTLAIENHGGITATSAQLLKIVKAVKSDWFGVNMDTGNFRTEEPYKDLEAVAPYTVTVQLKTEMFAKGKKVEEVDYARIAKILRGVGYQGYVALEYEAKEDPKVAVPKALAELKKVMG